MDPATVIGIVACVMSLAACCTSLGTLKHVTNKMNSEKQEKTTVHIKNKKVDEEKADGSTIHTQEQSIDIEDYDSFKQVKEQNLLKTGEPNKVAEALAGGAVSGLAAIQELTGGGDGALEVIGGVASSGIALLVAPKKGEDEEKHFEASKSPQPSPIISLQLPEDPEHHNMLGFDGIEQSITKKVTEIIDGLGSAPPEEDEDEDEDEGEGEGEQVNAELLPDANGEIVLEIGPKNYGSMGDSPVIELDYEEEAEEELDEDALILGGLQEPLVHVDTIINIEAAGEMPEAFVDELD